MNYREYAKKQIESRTDEEINNNVPFDPDTEMNLVSNHDTHTVYNVGGYKYYANNSTFDTVEHVDEYGEIIESWMLDY